MTKVHGRSSGLECGGSFEAQKHIRLLTFNIQVGISTFSYRHYLTRSWQHFLPNRSRIENLNKISMLLQHYDAVALQEVDGGSIRSGFVNQVQYLAEAGGFPYWYQQLNRNLGRVAQHSNGFLSRIQPLSVDEYRLPGIIPGRGAIVVKYGKASDPLVLVVMHLSLSAKAQNKQLGFIRDVISEYRHVVLMGDMNTHAERLLEESPLKGLSLVSLPGAAHSFPSWRPGKALDHILVSPSLKIAKAGVVMYPVSDHLPVALDIMLPDGC
ncbi:endonuclease/exonuclease/phosphatase family protein [Alkalimarinus alittae]|uniref:Endonuclease/exonuclease/phosphatase family protein n=1 Tax=Alkalimarinus alittae TaxID=2961619 RepID=A0ABY6N0P0_9ALTE|nr:endonuclease/exonuclease/phosphatase family protein [Alkalimarinus alittae]UZE95643.1 endonuclease/exonuclease/phosphatase family protein [Alkalimarinus alittae]